MYSSTVHKMYIVYKLRLAGIVIQSIPVVQILYNMAANP
jgi:hypothetical protein